MTPRGWSCGVSKMLLSINYPMLLPSQKGKQDLAVLRLFTT